MMNFTSDGIIFDLDGTLIDSAPEIASALNSSLQAHDLATFSLSEVKALIGHGAPVLVRRALQARGIEDDDLATRILAAMLRTYEVSFSHTTLYPGVVETLQTLALPLAICTNKPVRATAAVLDHFGLTRHFGAIVGGDTLPQRKPDPAPLLHAARLIGARRPVLIGDSEVDAQTARAAGIPFILFTGGYLNGEVHPDARIDRIDNLKAIFGTGVI